MEPRAPFDKSANRAFVAPMSQARVHHTATVLANGSILVAGGQNGATTVSNSTELLHTLEDLKRAIAS